MFQALDITIPYSPDVKVLSGQVLEDVPGSVREAQAPIPEPYRVLRRRLDAHDATARLVAIGDRHRHEVLSLINDRRRVALAWHRCEGPALLATVMSAVRDGHYGLPSSVKGVTPHDALVRMRAALGTRSGRCARRWAPRTRADCFRPARGNGRTCSRTAGAMKGAPKTREDVLANPQAFDAARARAEKLFKTFPGVVGLGTGQKQTGGTYQNNIAIVVFVREKRPEDTIPPEQRIPQTFEGYPTDVMVVPTAHPLACDNTAVYKPIRGGIQIAGNAWVEAGTPPTPPMVKMETGTIACIVKKRNDSGRENVYLLTCMRIFQAGDRPGDHGFRPFPPAPPNQTVSVSRQPVEVALRSAVDVLQQRVVPPRLTRRTRPT